jgi:hypothetical protein
MKLRYLNALAMQIYLLRVRFGIISIPSKEVVIHIYGSDEGGESYWFSKRPMLI